MDLNVDQARVWSGAPWVGSIEKGTDERVCNPHLQLLLHVSLTCGARVMDAPTTLRELVISAFSKVET